MALPACNPLGNGCFSSIVGCNGSLHLAGGRLLKYLVGPLWRLFALDGTLTPIRLVVICLTLAYVDELMLSSLVQNVSDNAVAQVDDIVEMPGALVLRNDLLLTFLTEVLLLNLYQLIQVIFQLVLLQLIQVVLTQNHVLNQLGYFLVQFYNVWLSMDEVLNRLPVQELTFDFLGTTTE